MKNKLSCYSSSFGRALPIKRGVVGWLCCCIVFAAAAQQNDCEKYRQAIAQGQNHLEGESFDLALIEFQAAMVAVRECRLTDQDRKRAQGLLELAFDGLEKETNEAQEAREKAVKAETIALRRQGEAEAARDASARALARANAFNRQNLRLLDALYFYDDRYALAVRQRDVYSSVQYGYIDKNGRALINYKYDAAEPFESNGLARVEFEGQKMLIDTLGREYPLAEAVEELTAEIQALDLRGQFITVLPDTVFNFPELRIVLLGGNLLRGLPDQFDQLPQLEILDLGRNSLDSLPPSMQLLGELRELDLSGTGLRRLPDWMKSLTDLQLLDLSELRLGELPEWLGNLQQLTTLRLKYNTLEALPASFRALEKLEILDLQHNKLTGIPAYFQAFERLRRLDLDYNQLGQLPEFIGNWTQLEDLSLASTRLESIPLAIGALSKLLYLDLQANQLAKLPPSFGRLSQLRRLNLSRNPLEGLPDYLGRFDQLRGLYLDFMGSLNGLENWLGELEQLEVLSLIGNPMESPPGGLERLIQLEDLRMDGCRLARLSPAIGRLKRLERLRLSGNSLTKLPVEIGQLERLKLLALDNNQLEALPASIGQLRSLSALLLNRNRLLSLPDELIQCRRLETLDIGANQLEKLPEGIGMLPQLEKLALSGNRLVALPAQLGYSNRPLIEGVLDNPLKQLPGEAGEWDNQTLSLQLIRFWNERAAREADPDTLRKLHLDMVRLYEGYVQQLQKGVVARERDLIGRYTSGFSTDQEELDQELAVAYNDLSWFRMLTGHFAEAEEALRKGIERDPSFRNLYSKLAPALLLQGKIDAAKAEYLQRKDQPYIPGRFPTYASAFESILDQLERLQLIPDSLQGAVAEIRQLLQNQ